MFEDYYFKINLENGIQYKIKDIKLKNTEYKTANDIFKKIPMIRKNNKDGLLTDISKGNMTYLMKYVENITTKITEEYDRNKLIKLFLIYNIFMKTIFAEYILKYFNYNKSIYRASENLIAKYYNLNNSLLSLSKKLELEIANIYYYHILSEKHFTFTGSELEKEFLKTERDILLKSNELIPLLFTDKNEEIETILKNIREYYLNFQNKINSLSSENDLFLIFYVDYSDNVLYPDGINIMNSKVKNYNNYLIYNDFFVIGLFLTNILNKLENNEIIVNYLENVKSKPKIINNFIQELIVKSKNESTNINTTNLLLFSNILLIHFENIILLINSRPKKNYFDNERIALLFILNYLEYVFENIKEKISKENINEYKKLIEYYSLILEKVENSINIEEIVNIIEFNKEKPSKPFFDDEKTDTTQEKNNILNELNDDI